MTDARQTITGSADARAEADMYREALDKIVVQLRRLLPAVSLDLGGGWTLECNRHAVWFATHQDVLVQRPVGTLGYVLSAVERCWTDPADPERVAEARAMLQELVELASWAPARPAVQP